MGRRSRHGRHKLPVQRHRKTQRNGVARPLPPAPKSAPTPATPRERRLPPPQEHVIAAIPWLHVVALCCYTILDVLRFAEQIGLIARN